MRTKADTQRRLDLAKAKLETWTTYTPRGFREAATARTTINQLRLDIQTYERALAAYQPETPNAQNLPR